MRDEKTKLRDLLQEKENEQLAQIKKMQALMSQKDQEGGKPSKVEDSIGESGTMSKGGKSGITESYDTDTFEDHSASVSQSHGSSGKKNGIQWWPGKDAMDGSISASQSIQ